MRWTLIGCAAIVVFEAGWSLAAAALDFEIGDFPQVVISASVETAIFILAAFGAARDAGRARAGALSGAIVAFAGATIGWAVSWLIGPGAPAPENQTPLLVALTVTTVTGLGAAFGLAAGVIAQRFRRPTTGP